jgi:hypothetical protein
MDSLSFELEISKVYPDGTTSVNVTCDRTVISTPKGEVYEVTPLKLSKLNSDGMEEIPYSEVPDLNREEANISKVSYRFTSPPPEGILWNKNKITFVYKGNFRTFVFPNGHATASEFAEVICDFEKEVRQREKDWFDGIDDVHTGFEGIEEKYEGVYSIRWGS